MKKTLAIVAAAAAVSVAWAQTPAAPAKISLTRLDCGTVQVNDLNQFSDTLAYPGQKRKLTSSCYLIRHGDSVMIWDAGLPAALKGAPLSETAPMSANIGATMVEQLATLGVKPADVKFIGISHMHFDHIGQVSDFPAATLLIGKGDWALISATPPGRMANPAPFKHWLSGGGKVEAVEGDKDVFGDGSVTMLGMPGHTPGHSALLVRLKKAGPVLLSGDQFHFQENYDSDGVPGFNFDRAATLASHARFKALARNLNAKVIIQHEPRDIGKLPAFPAAAE